MQQITLADTSITCLPCVHFSGCGFFDRNKTLWTSFAIKDENKKYGSQAILLMVKYSNKLVKKQHTFDIVLIGIAPYEPRDFMSSVHATPEEAIKIAIDIKAKKTIGCCIEDLLDLRQSLFFEPPKRFKQATIDQHNMVKKIL